MENTKENIQKFFTTLNTEVSQDNIRFSYSGAMDGCLIMLSSYKNLVSELTKHGFTCIKKRRRVTNVKEIYHHENIAGRVELFMDKSSGKCEVGLFPTKLK